MVVGLLDGKVTMVMIIGKEQIKYHLELPQFLMPLKLDLQQKIFIMQIIKNHGILFK